MAGTCSALHEIVLQSLASTVPVLLELKKEKLALMLNELKGFVDVSNTSWNEKKGTVLPQFKLFKGKDTGLPGIE